jgi:phage FluMu protein Com
LIQHGSSNPANYIDGNCTWYTNFTVNPADLNCVLTYCTNGTNDPVTNGLNYQTAVKSNKKEYNFTQQERVSLGRYLDYKCKKGNKLNDDVKFITEAPDYTRVSCKSDGEFNYPDPWPPCLDSVECPDPGNTLTKNHTFNTRVPLQGGMVLFHPPIFKFYLLPFFLLGTTNELIKTVLNGTGETLTYKVALNYKCKDARKFLKYGASSNPVASRTYICYWKKVYEVILLALHCYNQGN